MDLAEAKRLEHDEIAIRIQWESGKSPYFSPGKYYVLEKVTAKQISIRLSGHSRSDRYNLDGSSVSRHGHERIDIRKTFGIDSDSVPPNWKPESK
jgi:hypothetical protein